MSRGAVVWVLLSGSVVVPAGASAVPPAQPPATSTLKEASNLPADVVAPATRNDVVLGHIGRLYADALTASVRAQRRAVTPGATPLVADRETAVDPRRRPARPATLARDAFARMTQNAVNELPLVHRTRAVLQQLGTVELHARNGRLELQGPTLAALPRPTSVTPPVIRTRLTLDDGADLALTWETTAGPFRSRLSYAALPRTMTASLTAQLSSFSSVELGLQRAATGPRLGACLNLRVP